MISRRILTLHCVVVALGLTALGIAQDLDDEAAECTPHWSLAAGTPGLDAWVYTLYVWDDGNGPQLYAGGYFRTAGGRVAQGVARWDGYDWRPLGDGIDGLVMTMANFDDGNGDALYVGGLFSSGGERSLTNIARWDPRERTWSDVGGGVDDVVIALAAHHDGERAGLYAGGSFQTAGGTRARNIAMWDGSEWHDLGGGVDDTVRAFAILDEGDGPRLFAGGIFNQAGGAPASKIARWDGTQWSSLPGTFSGQGIRTMTVHDDGTGPAIYVGGVFASIDRAPFNSIARWDPKTDTWLPLSTGVNERVVNLTTFDDGTGSMLYAAGWFTSAGEQQVNRVARWDGRQWSPLAGTDLNNVARAMARFPDAETGNIALYIGGGFRMAGGRPSGHVAAWVGCCAAQVLIPSDEPLGRVPDARDEARPSERGRGAVRDQPAQRQRPPARPQPGRGRGD